MYKSALGLKEAPFGITPDPKFVYLSSRHRNALAGLTYGILARKRFILLTGDVGTGKTTLIRTAVKHLPLARTRVGLILNSTLTAQEVVEATLSSFGLTAIPSSKVERLSRFKSLIEADESEGRTCTLIIDEAHKLGYDALEEIRLLGNLDSLQIVLAGQNELVELLEREELRAFKQRISLRLSVEPLIFPEVALYVAHRWVMAGGKLPVPFDSQAMERIAYESRGIPRLINILCDNSLMTAFLDSRNVTTVRDVLEAAAELHLPASKKIREGSPNAAQRAEEVSRTLTRPPEKPPLPADVPAAVRGVFGRVLRMTRSGQHLPLPSSK